MKIAARISMTALASLLVVGVAHSAMAETSSGIDLGAMGASAANVSEQSPSNASTGSTNNEQPELPLPREPEASNTSVENVLVAIKAPVSAAAVEEKGEEKEPFMEGKEAPDSDRVPSSVKKIVKNLSDTSENVTLQDLNAAREAIVKLDVLIDIEKRLNDLSKIRKERDESEGGGDLSAALPANALASNHQPMMSSLAYPALQPMPPQAMPLPAAPSFSGGASVQVTRVTGASGVYTALITDLDGAERRVHVGDKLSDGSVISAISSSGVSVKAQGSRKAKTVQVTDVNRVFSGR